MYRIFIKPTLDQVIAVSALTRLKEVTMTSHDTMVKYYRQSGSSINNDHILIKLIFLLADAYHGNDSSIYNQVRNRPLFVIDKIIQDGKEIGENK